MAGGESPRTIGATGSGESKTEVALESVLALLQAMRADMEAMEQRRVAGEQRVQSEIMGQVNQVVQASMRHAEEVLGQLRTEGAQYLEERARELTARQQQTEAGVVRVLNTAGQHIAAVEAVAVAAAQQAEV